MINAIIFDVGDTLTFNDWKYRLKAVERDVGSINWFTPATKVARDKASTGKTRMEEALRTILEENNSSVPLSTFVASYKRNFMKYTKVNKEMISLVKRLSINYELYAFSNTNNLHAAITTKRGVYKLFKKSFLSHKIGFKKPDKKSFAFVLQRIRQIPSELLFIDDNEKNLKMAATFGMKTIHYTGLAGLKKDLIKLGVKI